MGLKQEGFRLTIIPGENRPGIISEITKIIAEYGENITHSSAFGPPSQETIVFRINMGSADKIINALTKLSYIVSIHMPN